MGLPGVVFRLTITVLFFSCMFMLPSFEWHRHKLAELFKTFPLNWFGTVTNVDSSPDVSKNIIRSTTGDLVLTKEELAGYNGGEGSRGLYIAILGRVYDVKMGSKSYGTGGGYSFFAGRDGTKAFVTGEFNAGGLVDDISALSPQQMLEALRWLQFYEKTYPYVGKVVGYFYDVGGYPTEGLVSAQRLLETGLELQRQDEDHKKIFPPCNSHWTDRDGTTVWCSDKSGGIVRDWDGVPRLYFDQRTQLTTCVCVRPTGQSSDPSRPAGHNGDLSNPNLREYTGCSTYSNACKVISM